MPLERDRFEDGAINILDIMTLIALDALGSSCRKP